MNRLDGKVALITGGARGMGASTAELFVAAGADVVITDVRDALGAETADRLGDRCWFQHHDVTSDEDWLQTVDTVTQTHGRLDVLVNNAGIYVGGGVADTPLDVWDQVVAVNQTGVFLGMQRVVPAMKAGGGGSIVNFSSIAGLSSAALAHAYSATKWAVRGMSKCAAVELGPSGIRVNSVHPGLIETDMLHEVGERVLERVAPRVPLRRLGQPDDVGRVVLFLASDDSSYCTGHEFVVDGGVDS